MFLKRKCRMCEEVQVHRNGCTYCRICENEIGEANRKKEKQTLIMDFKSKKSSVKS